MLENKNVLILDEFLFTESFNKEVELITGMRAYRLKDLDDKRRTQTQIILCGWKSELNQTFLSTFPSLNYIGVRATSLDRIDLDFALKNNITIKNIYNYGDQGTAEFVIEKLIGFARKGKTTESPSELFQKKLGLVGLGAVGTIVARIAESIGMEVCYYTPKRKESKYEYKNLNTLLSEVNYISFHSPAYLPVLSKEQLKLIPERTSLIVTTLGLPFSIADFVSWKETHRNLVIFDLCSAQNSIAELENLPNIEIERIYSARTEESIKRAETEMIRNLRLFV